MAEVAETLQNPNPKPTKSNPVANISNAIKQAEVEVREKYPFFNYQDTCATVIFFAALLAVGGCWVYYFKNPYSYAHCALVIAMVTVLNSILHELEHDLIHNLYFKKYPVIQDIMFFCIWISKLHSNPWYRREMHLKHHILSGQVDDGEERLIGLGIPFGFRRLAVSMHPFGALISMYGVFKDTTWLSLKRLNLTSTPVATIFFVLTKVYMVYLGAMWYFGDRWVDYLPQQHWWWIRAANVCVCIPGILRQACLQTMANTSHYYGDIPEKSLFYQNQILDHWILFPYQFFSMNFGATHVVHHYIPGQPFYIRELVYRRVKNYMIEQGVRINDFGVLLRANHYFNKPIPVGKDISALSTTTNKVEKEEFIAPNNSQTHIMAIWFGMEVIFGMLTYVIFDQWAFGNLLVFFYKLFMEIITGKNTTSKTTASAADKQKST